MTTSLRFRPFEEAGHCYVGNNDYVYGGRKDFGNFFLVMKILETVYSFIGFVIL